MDKLYGIATRKSPLALWQAEYVQRLLTESNLKNYIYPVVTTGDKIQTQQLADTIIPHESLSHLSTGKGLFIKEVQEALLQKQAHLAVHSMKDLPITQTPGLCLSTVLPRGSFNDVIVFSKELLSEIGPIENLNYDELKNKLLSSKALFQKPIGTTSSRRQMLIRKYLSTQVSLVALRGNVGTRLKRLQENQFSAIILAKAGLLRLGLWDATCMFDLPSNLFVPAAGQGVVSIEVEECAEDLIAEVRKWNCPSTVVSTGLERLMLSFLEGDCHSAIGICFQEGRLDLAFGKNQREYISSLSLGDHYCRQALEIFYSCDSDFGRFFRCLLKSSLGEILKKEASRAMG